MHFFDREVKAAVLKVCISILSYFSMSSHISQSLVIFLSVQSYFLKSGVTSQNPVTYLGIYAVIVIDIQSHSSIRYSYISKVIFSHDSCLTMNFVSFCLKMLENQSVKHDNSLKHNLISTTKSLGSGVRLYQVFPKFS